MWKGFILLFVCLNFSVLGYSFCLSSMYCIFLSCISLFLHTFPQNLLASHFCKMRVWFDLLLEFLISLLQLFLYCSILTPYYKEDVLFSLQNLEEPNEDGVSILFYLQKIYPGYFLTCLPFTWTDIHAIFFGFALCPLKLTFCVLTSLKMNGKISSKGWAARMKRNSVKTKNWKRSFVFGRHIGGRH